MNATGADAILRRRNSTLIQRHLAGPSSRVIRKAPVDAEWPERMNDTALDLLDSTQTHSCTQCVLVE